MKKSILLFAAIPVLFSSCSTNAVTGRQQLSLFPESTLQEEAVSQYKQFLTENKVVTGANSKDAEMVKRVGNRLASAITQYYKTQANPVDLSGYKWEFNLVNNGQVNAWCMPGGKVVVYTGLLPVAQNEAALAVVMGHEITHALAKHGNERMSQAAMAQGLQVAGNIFTTGNTKANALFNNIFAPGAQVGVLLPNSRKQELEADRFGLIFTAMAGYNPNEAVAFWQRMAAASNGQKPPELLSTHPSDESRINQIKKYLPDALKYYKPVR
ncbi:MAG TPA: M48 family metallopeptidase [Ferruginibacter sp.]|nr:M48 family metallopeptidase [Ferruginibacter sp.]HRE63877.1 M48 family metallopeptidase [Ferruginibacter sp.]